MCVRVKNEIRNEEKVHKNTLLTRDGKQICSVYPSNSRRICKHMPHGNVLCALFRLPFILHIHACWFLPRAFHEIIFNQWKEKGLSAASSFSFLSRRNKSIQRDFFRGRLVLELQFDENHYFR